MFLANCLSNFADVAKFQIVQGNQKNLKKTQTLAVSQSILIADIFCAL